MDELTQELNELACKLAAAKKAETLAKNARIEAEEAIAVLVETEVNGSKTVDAGEGLRLTVKREMGYKVDIDAIREMDLDPDDTPLTLSKPKAATYMFDKKKYEAVIVAHPDLAAKLSEHVIATPRKVSVSLKIA